MSGRGGGSFSLQDLAEAATRARRKNARRQRQAGTAEPPRTRSLSEMTHAELLNMRAEPGADQDLLAPFEHRAFAREWAQEHPVRASLSIPVATPLYAFSKMLGFGRSRSGASMDQVFAGIQGLGEGLAARRQSGRK